MNPLSQLISDMIRADGPVTVESFMEIALSHPDHG
jgi:SAM-dependent MidA family methyltransferase